MSDTNNPRPTHTHTNRLARESSPYLLQHQHNPVDWHPWGPEAFEAARRDDKPIFLSVGYSTCYWCHVMERQSFESEAVAAEMNRRFVNIKVDREERPDVDQLYMTAVQVLTRQGGWPMSVFLTPDLRPFFGGTYFPPNDAYGRPGFVTLLRGIDDAYRNRPADVEKTAAQLVDILRQMAEPLGPQGELALDADLVDSLIDRSTDDYDPHHGGFGNAPKFPRQTLLELLFAHLATPPRGGTADERRRARVEQMLLHTLDALAEGGIRDQLGGAFHRYSTDAAWLVPHFEIMLYDNAMLGWCYVEAHRRTGERRFADVARGIFDFILREMTSPEGAFYTAFDAEVDAMEGQSYLWTPQEIEALLGAEDAKAFNRVYGVDRGYNFADPHHGTGEPDKNILYLPESMAEVAAALNTDADALAARLAPMRGKLYEARRKRKQPLLDRKILTSWNALMIRAMAHGGQSLGEPRYAEAATRAAEFLLRHHRTPDGSLYRTSIVERPEGQQQGEPAVRAKYAAFLDDYAFLAQALLALQAATGADVWRDRARAVTAQMVRRFGGPNPGAFYFTQAGAEDLIVRQKVGTDSPLPSGNAVAAMVLLELGNPQAARAVLADFAQAMSAHGEGMSAMVQALILYQAGHGAFTVSRSPQRALERPASLAESADRAVSAASAWRGPTELAVRVAVAPSFHINAHEPGAGNVPLVPTTLSVIGRDDARVEYPAGEEQGFAFSGPFRVYEGEVELVVRFAKPPEKGQSVDLALSYQACDFSACLPPTTKRFQAIAEGT